MPTYDALPRFLSDLARLTPAQRAAYRAARLRFTRDLRSGLIRPGLRVKGVQGHQGVFEMTWAPDGRATFQYGREVRPGHTHII